MTAKELAATLGRSTRYVYDARRLGFSMPGGVATVSEFRSFLSRIPNPTVAARLRR